LKASGNLDETRDESARLEEALSLNEPLTTAYYLKQELRPFWDKPTKGKAARFLKGWHHRARASGIKILETMANTLESRFDGLIDWSD
jgi:transposase